MAMAMVIGREGDRDRDEIGTGESVCERGKVWRGKVSGGERKRKEKGGCLSVCLSVCL